MYEGSHRQIEPKLAPLVMDAEILLFCGDGFFNIGGIRTSADAVEADFIWLSQHVKADGHFNTALDAALNLKGLKVLQTFNAGLDDPAYHKVAEAGITICNSSA